MPRPRTLFFLGFALAMGAWLPAADTEELIREGLAAEARRDPNRALELFLAAEPSRPVDSFLLQKIARQFSDLAIDLKTDAEKRAAIERALSYALRAVELNPNSSENVLSVAICHGKLAAYGDIREKVRCSRLVRENTERAIALNPQYAWAHHVLGRWHTEVIGLGRTSRFVVKMLYGGLPSASIDEAVRHLERAVQLEPDQLAHHLELGFAYAAARQPARAKAEFEAGLAMPSRDKHDDPAKDRARAALARLDSG